MNRPFMIYRLQQIDSQLDGLQVRLKTVQIALEDNLELLEWEKKLTALKEEMLQAKNKLRSAEFETQGQRIKIEQTEAALYGGKVRNPKELQDLQHETAALKRFLVTLEERQFEAMLVEEDASGQFEAASREHEDFLSADARRIQELNLENEKILKDLARSEQERQAAASSIETRDLDLYDQLRLKRKGIAVSRVVDRACSACGSTLSAALLSASHSPNELNLCDRCGRILYKG
jgi:hypothetical protein